MSKQTKDIQRAYFYDNAVVTDEQLDNVVDSSLGVLDSIDQLPTASASNVGDEYKIGNTFYKCVLNGGNYEWQVTGNAQQVSVYGDLTGKPKLEGVTINGNVTLSQIGALSKDVDSYNTKNLDDGDVCYVINDGVVYKTTIGDIRKPRQEVITISSTDWSNGECTKSVSGVTSSSVIVASPNPEYASVFFANPFWCASVCSGTITFKTSSAPSTTVKMNVIIY